MMSLVEHRDPVIPLVPACRALSLSRSAFYGRRPASLEQPQRTARHQCVQPRALNDSENQAVLAVLNSDEFCDQPPYEVYQQLLQQAIYLCSVSTMYRLLRRQRAVGERRKQRPAQHHAIPRLLATEPNEVWTRDITKLATQQRGKYLSLYVVIDLFSRFVVAWMISRKENSALAQQLMDEALVRYGVGPGQLTIHQDRGAPMTAHNYLELMGEFKVTSSHSRPRVSNDNPFSESQFKTCKYQPDYPGVFTNVSHSRQWFERYFDWYNFDHHHSGLEGYTPEQVFTGQHEAVHAERQKGLDDQYGKHPERFVAGRPLAARPPSEVAINPITPQMLEEGAPNMVNFPTLPVAQNILMKNTLILD